MNPSPRFAPAASPTRLASITDLRQAIQDDRNIESQHASTLAYHAIQPPLRIVLPQIALLRTSNPAALFVNLRLMQLEIRPAVPRELGHTIATATTQLCTPLGGLTPTKVFDRQGPLTARANFFNRRRLESRLITRTTQCAALAFAVPAWAIIFADAVFVVRTTQPLRSDIKLAPGNGAYSPGGALVDPLRRTNIFATSANPAVVVQCAEPLGAYGLCALRDFTLCGICHSSLA